MTGIFGGLALVLPRGEGKVNVDLLAEFNRIAIWVFDEDALFTFELNVGLIDGNIMRFKVGAPRGKVLNTQGKMGDVIWGWSAFEDVERLGCP